MQGRLHRVRGKVLDLAFVNNLEVRMIYQTRNNGKVSM